MKIALNWLKEYINTSLEVDKIATILTDIGLEVEGVEKIQAIKGGLENVVIGQIITCDKHPDADRLNITSVNIGREDNLQIVCGAPNIAKGQKVVVAKVGATLYPKPDEQFKIKKSKIRGVESFGMICAEDELGIGASHDGIMVLNEDAVVGSDAAAYFDLQDDYLIEIGLTPNRADAMGHVGVARDLKAYLNVHENENLKLNFPIIDTFKVDNHDLPIRINVHDHDLCPRYLGLTINNVQVKTSPEWLQKRLRAIGLSPVNNVVDATNYVLHELGTPLHAFDASVVNGEINVRKAKDGETLLTLDDVERKLSSKNLVIANKDKALCLAGIMGGKHSGVSEKTSSIFLEAAYFNPVSIRKTAKEFGFNTDASFRFERGIDIDLIDFALKRAALLIKTIAGGTIAMEPNDIYPNKIAHFKINFRPQYCNAIIGVEIETSIQAKILEELDIIIEHKNKESWELAVPCYRVDVQREIDVIEEVLRIYGFNKVTLPEKLSSSLSFRSKIDAEKLQNKTADQLVALGFSEIMNNSLTNSNYIEKLGGEVLKKEQNINILNPLSNELNVMRQTLVFQAMETIAYNQNRQQANLKIFEFGKTYKKFNDNLVENKRLLIAITGNKAAENWSNANEITSFFTLKGIVDALYIKLGLANLTKEKNFSEELGAGIVLKTGQATSAELFIVSKQLTDYFGIKQDVFIANIDWDVIIQSSVMNKVKFSPLPKTQVVRRDFSLLLDNDVSYAQLKEIAFKTDRKLLKKINLFDVYEGKKMEKGKKSYAISFQFQDGEKTLKDEQVDTIMKKIRIQYEKELGASLR